MRTPALVRGFAKKFKFTGDLGWDKLRAELLRLPVKLPELKALALTSSRIPGMRHQGARVFHLEFGAPLRYQNPDALITFRATKEPFSNIVVELASGEQHTLDVAGMQSSEILERVLDVSGMPAAERATTIHIVTTQLKPNAAQHASATRPPRATERDGSAGGPERGLCGVGGPERLWGWPRAARPAARTRGPPRRRSASGGTAEDIGPHWGKAKRCHKPS